MKLILKEIKDVIATFEQVEPSPAAYLALETSLQDLGQVAHHLASVADRKAAYNASRARMKSACDGCGHSIEDHDCATGRCYNGSGSGNTCACTHYEEPK